MIFRVDLAETIDGLLSAAEAVSESESDAHDNKEGSRSLDFSSGQYTTFKKITKAPRRLTASCVAIFTAVWSKGLLTAYSTSSTMVDVVKMAPDSTIVNMGAE